MDTSWGSYVRLTRIEWAKCLQRRPQSDPMLASSPGMILALRLFCIFTFCLVTDKIRSAAIESLVTALTPGIMGSRIEHGLTRVRACRVSSVTHF